MHHALVHVIQNQLFAGVIQRVHDIGFTLLHQGTQVLVMDFVGVLVFEILGDVRDSAHAKHRRILGQVPEKETPIARVERLRVCRDSRRHEFRESLFTGKVLFHSHVIFRNERRENIPVRSFLVELTHVIDALDSTLTRFGAIGYLLCHIVLV